MSKEIKKENRCKFYGDELIMKGKFINWKLSIGKHVKVMLNDVIYEFEILGHSTETKKVKLLYENKIVEAYTSSLTRCQIRELVGLKSREFKFNIEDVIVDNKRDILLIDTKNTMREVKINNTIRQYNMKWYKYHCNKCDNEDWMLEGDLLFGNGCNVCCICPKKTTKNNCLGTLRPDLIKFFKNKDDAYKYTIKSNKKVICWCESCGYEREMIVANLNKRGFTCPICSDGVSYPEKFILTLLKELNVEFKWQVTKSTFNWCDKYRYDFYLPEYNIIIESHGKQHYEESSYSDLKFGSLINQQKIDTDKRSLAMKNGLTEYFEIDCRKSDMEWIKAKLIQSGLMNIFPINIDNIDWENIDEVSRKSILKNVCNMKKENPNITSTIIAEKTGLSVSTVINYQKIGNDLGLCEYNSKDERVKSTLNMIANKKKKRVIVYKDNILMNVFNSAKEIELNSESMFGVKLNANKIRSVCVGHQKTHKGFSFRYEN